MLTVTGTMKRAPLGLLLSAALVASQPAAIASEAPAPAAVGWGNLFVPGMGATLRGEPKRGLLEATGTLGSYFGGTYLAEEAHFSMDGSVDVPDHGAIMRPLVGQFMQEVGLKAHMYNTFYNYQQASLDPANADLQLKYQQPLYKGSWDEVLLAPFKPKNLLTPWSIVPITLSSALLYYSYRTSTPDSRKGQSSFGQDAMFGFTQGIGVPIGSSFGEEVLWRGFMQREFHLYTGSLLAAVAMQTVTFAAVHTPRLRPGAALGGIYFGVMVDRMDGNLEPAIATHFWVDFISAIFNYLEFRRSEGRGVPLAVGTQIPF